MFELFTKWRAKPVTAVTGTVTGNPFGNINEDSNVTTVTSVTNKKQSAVPESDVKASHSDDAGNSPSSAAGAVTPVTSVTNQVISSGSSELAPVDTVTTAVDAAVTPVTQNLDIEHRLTTAGIAIAIDNIDGSGWLVFNSQGREAVRDVARVYEPFEVQLTERQRQELTEALECYNVLLRRQGNGKEES